VTFRILPFLVLREVTERPEGVEAGTVKVVGVKRQDILRETVRLLEDPVAYAGMASAVNPNGDGKASRRIVQALLDSETVEQNRRTVSPVHLDSNPTSSMEVQGAPSQ